ncbi:unnamed protein product [Chrysoparadoxa australica]
MKNPREVSPGEDRGKEELDSDGDVTDVEAGTNSEDELSPTIASRRSNFSGVWRRVRAEGFVDLLVFSGVSERAARCAAKRNPIHIVDHDDCYFRLIVKNGLVKADTHYIIGDEAKEKAGRHEYTVSLDWGVGSASSTGEADALVLSSFSETAGTEMIASRSLEGSDTLILHQVVRKPASGEEARCKHVFRRIKDIGEIKQV